MKPVTIIAILLIVLGLAAFVFPEITYTQKEEVLQVGPLEASVETRRTVPLPAILGGLSLAGGIGLLFIGRRTNSDV